MSRVPCDELPDEARTWIFGADRSPSPSEAARLVDTLGEFVDEWTAHRRELRAGVDWLHHRFLLVALDESRVGASGCSIDDLMRHVGEIARELDLELLDGSPVWFRDPEGRVRRVSRDAFRSLGRQGEVDRETPVFDLTVDRLGPVRDGRWIRPAGESWHASLLPDDAGPDPEDGPPNRTGSR